MRRFGRERKTFAHKTDHVGGYSKGVSKYDKLVTKNANRGLKKSTRQKVIREIKQRIDE